MPSNSHSALLPLPAHSGQRRPSPSRAAPPTHHGTRDSRENRDGQATTDESSSEFSRVTGYHNAMALDESTAPSDSPPSYHDAQIEWRLQQGNTSTNEIQLHEKLPAYSCSVEIEGALGMKIEKTSPFESVPNPQWSDIYCIVQGTMLRIHQAKSSHIFGKAIKSDKKPGRLIKSYTLQHAEVGIAADHKKIELVPKVHFATLLPQATLQLLQMSEPHMFTPVRQYVIRLRLETDQLLLRFDSSSDRAEWIDKLCQAVDVSPPLEVRTEPKYHTLPRRRRRRNAERTRVDVTTVTTDPDVVREQERMIREFFPQLQDVPTPGSIGEDATVQGEVIDASNVDINEVEGGPQVATGAPDPDQDDLDREFVVDGDAPGRPMSRLVEEPSRGMAPDGAQPAVPKSTPSTIPKRTTRATMDPAMLARYRRRCMPSLLYNSRRADDIVISNGKRWKLDWDAHELKPYVEGPPEYPNDDSSDRSSSSEEAPASRTLRQLLKLTPTATVGSTNSSLVDTSAQPEALIGVKSDRPQRPPTIRTNSGGKELQGLTQRFKRMTSKKPVEAESAGS